MICSLEHRNTQGNTIDGAYLRNFTVKEPYLYKYMY